MQPFEATEDYALHRDKQDPLAPLQAEFYRQPGRLYMDGNSLGLLGKRAEQNLLDALASWKEQAIDGWTQGERPWFYLAEEIAALQAPLVGTQPRAVTIANSTTINIHQLVATFFQPDGQRRRILADSLTFPTDLYALAGQLRLHNLDPRDHLVLAGDPARHILDEDEIIAAMDDTIALVLLPTVLYRSGQLLDIPRLVEAAHKRGILIGFDACHSAGVIPHHFDEWDVDFAVWCNYKYLNGGPGAIASLYVNERHWQRRPALAGWWGSDKARQFDLTTEWQPAAGAGAYQVGTIPVLSAAPLLGALEVIQEAGLEQLREKSLALTSYLLWLLDNELSAPPYNFTTCTPRDPARRGGHVALQRDQNAWQINLALKKLGVIPDFRPPNIIRLAPVPLYTSFHDVWEVVQRIRRVIDEQLYTSVGDQSQTVT